MQNLYGPAIVLGLIIGGAIIADDFIRPHPRHGPMAMAVENAPQGLQGPHGDHKVWVMKKLGDEDKAIHREMRIVMDDESEDTDHNKTVIMVRVDDEQIDAGTNGKALANAISGVVDAARAQGREPTEGEIAAAVSAVSGQASQIEVEVDVTEVRSQPE